MPKRIPTSRVLSALVDEATAKHASLRWLMDRLGERSFGIILRAPPAITRAFHLSPLDDAVRGDETVGWRRGALDKFHSFCSCSIEQHSPAIGISLVAFAYLEEDATLLSLALLAALVLLAVVTSGAIWRLASL